MKGALAHTERAVFSDQHDRANLMLLGGSTQDRAQLFSTWDAALPQRSIPGSSTPHRFAEERATLDVDYEHDGGRHTLDDYLERHAVAGLLVLVDGTIVHQRHRLGTDPGTRWHLWSATKSFTGTLVGRALQEGVIASLDDLVSEHIDIRGGYALPTLRDLLMMSSGVGFFHFSGTPNRQDMYRRVWGQGGDLDDFAAALPPRVGPGTDFNYVATDTHVLSMVLRAVYERPLHEIMREQLWEPLGVSGDAFWSQHASAANGHAFGHACLNLRLVDFAHLGELYVNDGVWNGRRLLPAGFVEESCTPRAPFQQPSPGSRGYGYQWWVPSRSQGESIALGAFGQMLWVDRRRKVSIAQFAAGSVGEGEAPDAVEEVHAVMREIARTATD